MRSKLFEYAILLHPKDDKDTKTSLLKSPTAILAKDEKQVGMLVAREIPNEYLDCLDQIEVIVRPF